MHVKTVSGFFGRRDVLRRLSEQLALVSDSGRGRMLALRGRRQVGKSTLVERFVENAETPYVFVSGVYRAPLSQQLDAATAAVRESRRPLPDGTLLSATTASSWREWLGRVALAARGGPIIVVLDEFPWLAQGDVSLEGELQAQWDRVLEGLPVLLILIGSDVAMMDALSHHGRPLFGRLTPLVVSALSPADIVEALPGRPAEEVFDALMVTGGYPRLVTDLARHESVGDYVRLALQDQYSPLVTTARLSLDAEFPDPQAAYQVLAAIGANDTVDPGYSDILGELGEGTSRKTAETALTRSLKTLAEVKGLIEREQPSWAKPSSRLRRYRVTDPYLRFWFRYVERNVERISRGRSDLVIAAFERDWSTWRGQSIEPIVRQSVERLALVEPALADVESVLPWWVRDNSVEVDVVAATRTTTAAIGTIKWRSRGGITSRELDQLAAMRERVPGAADAKLIAICPTGQAPREVDLALSAADLIGAWG